MSAYEPALRSVCNVGIAMLTMVASRIVMIVPSNTIASAIHLYSKRPMRIGGVAPWLIGGATAATSVRSRTSVMRSLACVCVIPAVDDLAHEAHQHLEIVVAQRRQRFKRHDLARSMEPVEYLDTERGRRDVNGPAVLRVMTTLGEPEADHAIGGCARRTQCALLHARDLVHGRTAGRGAQLLQRTDLVPGDRPELARQLFRHAGHEPAL